MILVESRNIPIFGGKLSMLFTDEPELIAPYYNNDEIFEGAETFHGFATVMNFKGSITYVIGVVDKKGRKHTMGLIGHEAIHATQFLCNQIGYEAASESDEIYSHLVGYFVDEYVAFLKRIDKFDLFI